MTSAERLTAAPPLDDRRQRQIALAIAVLAVAVRLWMSQATHSTGEDFLITLRYAENIAAGRGFVYNPGERVLGTTTPLYTLLLAGAAWLGLNAALVGKAVNILADGVTCFLLARLLARREIGQPIAGLFAALLYALSSTPINISIGGMETGLVTCVGMAAILAYVARNATALYLLGATLFLLRIDGLLLFAILAGGLIWQERRIPWRAIGLGLLLALPWLIFAFLYFGSPIPTSLVAKLTVYARGVETSRHLILEAFATQFWTGLVQRILTLLFLFGMVSVALPNRPAPAARTSEDLTRGPSPSQGEGRGPHPLTPSPTLRERGNGEAGSPPSLAGKGDWVLGQKQRGNGEASMATARVGGQRAAGPTAAGFSLPLGRLGFPLLWLLIYYGAMFVSRVPPFAWYFLPPWPLFLGIAALGGSWLAALMGQRLPAATRTRLRPAWLVGLAACGLFGLAHLRSVRADIAKTQWQEDTLRVPIGRWLHAHARPDERILLEPIGYVGYYSQRPILDMIGLVSPEVFVSYRTPGYLADMVRRFRPAWLCLRPHEVTTLRRQDPSLPDAQYTYVREFHVPGRPPDFLLYHIRQDFPHEIAQ